MEIDTLKEFDGMLVSKDLAEKLAALHKRRASVNAKIYEIQDELHKVKGNNDQRTSELKVILNNYMSEQSGINERVKEFSVLHRCAVDQIMLQQLKEYDNDLFNDLLNKAKSIYSSKIKSSSHENNKTAKGKHASS